MSDFPVLAVMGPGVAAADASVARSPFVVGRDASCDLPLDFPWLSRRQLVFERGADDVWTVRSDGKNAVSLDGAPLEAARPLAPGACLAIGPLLLVWEPNQPRPLTLDDGDAGDATRELPVAQVLAGTLVPGVRPLARLAEASARLAALDEQAEVARAVAALAQDVLGARCAALLEDHADGVSLLASCGGANLRPNRKAVRRALDGQVVLSIEDLGARRSLAESAAVADAQVGPVLCAPLARPFAGVLYADRAAGARPFSADDAAFATVLAHLAGAALVATRRHESARVERDRLSEEIVVIQRDTARRRRFGDLIGGSTAMRKVQDAITRVAATEATVMITGETGSGKELVARELHRRSRRADKPMLPLNCAALPDALVESELFGHRRGAFTGADRDRRGLFELAEGGTVFLDEIGELPAAAQAKLLRALDQREITPLGAGRPVKIDVRLVTATHRDLDADVEAGRFRRDLLHRLKVFPIKLPALRERAEDIPELAQHLLARDPVAREKKIVGFTAAALEALRRGSFPGNVRELAHVLERAVILADEGEALDVGHLPDDLAVAPAPPEAAGVTAPPGLASADEPLRDAVARHERALIIAALDRHGWNRTATARALGVSLRAFMEKLARHQIKAPAPRAGD